MPFNRLLVIDDEPDVAATIGRVARRAGFDTIVTTDGADFLERAHSWLPTVVVLDLHMPELDGLEILAALAGQGSTAHVLIVSGYDRLRIDEAQAFGRDHGLNMVGVWQKPLRVDALRMALRAIYDDAGLISADDTIAALKRNEFFLEYQPIVDLGARRLVRVEALARWRHPARGVIPPDSFIPVMESAGVMAQFTPHVIAMAVSQARQWGPARTDLGLAINVSGACVGSLPLDDIIAQTCREQAVDPARLTIEITETAAMGDLGPAVAGLRRLKALGVRIAIDDFGTGYSSLVQLHRLPLTEIKIDRSFVRDCDTDRESQIIVGAIIDLARNFSLEVVAEGIETAPAERFLGNLGCEIGQGYFFSRPLSAERVHDWTPAPSPRATP